MGDVWVDIPPINSQARERVGYPTQKPLNLYERIVTASSDEGDMVLDPFAAARQPLSRPSGLNANGLELTSGTTPKTLS